MTQEWALRPSHAPQHQPHQHLLLCLRQRYQSALPYLAAQLDAPVQPACHCSLLAEAGGALAGLALASPASLATLAAAQQQLLVLQQLHLWQWLQLQEAVLFVAGHHPCCHLEWAASTLPSYRCSRLQAKPQHLQQMSSRTAVPV
jgi:hypothetical protein